MQNSNKQENQPAKTTQEQDGSTGEAAVERGRKAIEAQRIAAGTDKNDQQQQREDEADAEKWRNEG